MVIHTGMTFEDVEEKVENDGFRVHSAYTDGLGDPCVQLRGDGSSVDGTGVKMLEYYLESKEDLQRVKKEYMYN